MKLSDLHRVGELSKTLEYFETVRQALSKYDVPTIKVDSIHLRPEIVARIKPEIARSMDAETDKVKAELADLGVDAGRREAKVVGSQADEPYRVIEAADCGGMAPLSKRFPIGMSALTVTWPSGEETVEYVSEAMADLILKLAAK